MSIQTYVVAKNDVYSKKMRRHKLIHCCELNLSFIFLQKYQIAKYFIFHFC